MTDEELIAEARNVVRAFKLTGQIAFADLTGRLADRLEKRNEQILSMMGIDAEKLKACSLDSGKTIDSVFLEGREAEDESDG